MNKFKESIQIENFIREEQKKIRLDNGLSNKQKKEQLEVLEMALEDYKLAEREQQARENIIKRNEENPCYSWISGIK